MKKILFLFVALCVAIAGCKEKSVEEEFDNHAFFIQNPSYLQKIVNVENNQAPLRVQEYNKGRNNVVKIEFKKLVVTNGSTSSCKGYFTTVWTIKTEYFGEEQYEYLIPCEDIHFNPENGYTIWRTILPKEHPFADKL